MNWRVIDALSSAVGVEAVAAIVWRDACKGAWQILRKGERMNQVSKQKSSYDFS
jgi:hypothetical protein